MVDKLIAIMLHLLLRFENLFYWNDKLYFLLFLRDVTANDVGLVPYT